MLAVNLRDAVSNSSIRQYLAIRVELASGYKINLIDGSGIVAFHVDGTLTNFDGSDPTFGHLASASSFQEMVASDSPRFTFALHPPSASAIGSLADPKNQGSSVRAWWGIVDELSGLSVGEPELLWTGRLDIVRTQLGDQSLSVEIETVSAFDRLYVAEEGARLNGVWHQSIWPGETGLDYNIAALSDTKWGVETNKHMWNSTS